MIGSSLLFAGIGRRDAEGSPSGTHDGWMTRIEWKEYREIRKGAI